MDYGMMALNSMEEYQTELLEAQVSGKHEWKVKRVAEGVADDLLEIEVQHLNGEISETEYHRQVNKTVVFARLELEDIQQTTDYEPMIECGVIIITLIGIFRLLKKHDVKRRLLNKLSDNNQ